MAHSNEIITPTITPSLTHNASPQYTPQRNQYPMLEEYTFPEVIDPTVKYLFYLHGKIVEDQDFPIISPVYGEYEYLPILETFSAHGFHVISEKRPSNTDSFQYALYIEKQVNQLLENGVLPENITIIGASKGAGIAILLSNILKNKDINFIFMAICDPGTVQQLIENDVMVYGRILSIYDESDEYAGTYSNLFTFSNPDQNMEFEEIILDINKGHGMLYTPLDKWVIPAIYWANSVEQ